MVLIDGSAGEGGGQVLRTALGLSLVTQTPFQIVKIRGRRPKPGLQRQHLACVKAAAIIGEALVEGDALASQELVFRPRALRAGNYQFAIGSAGSTTLLLQALLPALLVVAGAERARMKDQLLRRERVTLDRRIADHRCRLHAGQMLAL